MRGRGGVVEVPVVVEIVVVRDHLAVVPVTVPHVEVAVRVAEMYEAPSMPLPIEYSLGCIEFRIIMR